MSWFKNLWIYRLNTKNYFEKQESLEEVLQPMRYVPCKPQDKIKIGWISPIDDGKFLTHSANGQLLLHFQREEKILPSSVIKKTLVDKIDNIKKLHFREPTKNEKATLKDEIIFDLLPRAFSKFIQINIWVDTLNQLIMVDSQSAKQAEEALIFLRKCLGTLPVIPLTMKIPIPVTLTRWVQSEKLPSDFELLNEIELRSVNQEEGVIRCKQQTPFCDEIKQHIASGKQVTKVAVEWKNRIQFLLCAEGLIRRIKYKNILKSEDRTLKDSSALEKFDADFALVTGECQTLIQRLISELGGLSEAQLN